MSATRVVIAEPARADLENLIRTHSLPADTGTRVRRSLQPLHDFPRMGAKLPGRWGDYRFIAGPWRWMIIVYELDEGRDLVTVVTIEDGRASTSPTRG